MWKEAVVNYSQELVWYLPTVTEENHNNPVGIPIILASILHPDPKKIIFRSIRSRPFLYRFFHLLMLKHNATSSLFILQLSWICRSTYSLTSTHVKTDDHSGHPSPITLTHLCGTFLCLTKLQALSHRLKPSVSHCLNTRYTASDCEDLPMCRGSEPSEVVLLKVP